MSARSLFRGLFWTLVALALVFHVAGGWYLSDEVIEDWFVPNPSPIAAPSGDYRLVEVTYEGPLGEMDAWHLPGSRSTWVIHVHGRGTTPAEAEHLFAPIQDAGYPQLAITYRNDDGQSSDPSGYYRYGSTEWEDIEAAMAFAQDNGATGVILSGFGAGASHVLSFAFKNNPDIIKGLVLDSPNANIGEVIEFGASKREIPGVPIFVPPSVTWVAKFITSLRIDVNWKTIDYVERADTSLRRPVLIHHGVEDETVPVSQSISLVEAAPDLVDLIQVKGAGHVETYAGDPERYVEEVLGFLRQVD